MATVQMEFLEPPRVPDVSAFERALKEAGGWVLARQLIERAGMENDDSHQRQLRRLAQASANVISGDKGYCHLDHATTEEICHCADRLLSQVRAMAARVARFRKVAHARLHRSPLP